MENIQASTLANIWLSMLVILPLHYKVTTFVSDKYVEWLFKVKIFNQAKAFIYGMTMILFNALFAYTMFKVTMIALQILGGQL